ncbi:MAG: hypothetical protein IAE97_01680 [Chthoniobacterales bacterium]|nr:hypothetical protein [Chthoniobacterales bacterium]
MAIPIYRKPVGGYESYLVSYYVGGRRLQRRAPTIEKAREIARSAARQLTEGEGRTLAALTPEELADFMAAQQILRQFDGVTLASVAAEWGRARTVMRGGSLLTAAEQYAKRQDEETMPEISIADLVDDFLESKRRAGLSARYVTECDLILDRFKKVFRCNLSTIRTKDLQQYLDKLKLGPRSKENVRMTIRTLFAHAKRRGYLARDRSTEAEHVDRIKAPATAPGIYSPEQMTKVIVGTSGLARLALALGAFAGLRSAEIHRLEWEDIGEQYITIAAHKAKTAARRLVPVLPPLKAVLDLTERGSGTVFSQGNISHFCAFMQASVSDAGVTPVVNGLRHSFCTYRLADIKSAAQVALEAGNSPKVLFTNYRELATADAAKAWFAIRPVGPRPRKGTKR